MSSSTPVYNPLATPGESGKGEADFWFSRVSTDLLITSLDLLMMSSSRRANSTASFLLYLIRNMSASFENLEIVIVDYMDTSLPKIDSIKHDAIARGDTVLFIYLC